MHISYIFFGGPTMTRIVIDLPEEDLRQLDNLKNIRHVPRAEIIRQAVSRYLT
ncbi:ribbon-helix-helix domain-containing protein, partial [Serratia sp. CY81166]|uniref:ribbon-helix-helix domain-containing protein n=1 Tax=Serratia sp. CY81166 TaxID=3383683 RepID=UPI003F9EC62F